MAYVTATSTAPFGAETTLRVVNFITETVETVVAAHLERKTRKILSRLSPEQLDDIGLSHL